MLNSRLRFRLDKPVILQSVLCNQVVEGEGLLGHRLKGEPPLVSCSRLFVQHICTYQSRGENAAIQHF
jgi:hypothetical protein